MNEHQTNRCIGCNCCLEENCITPRQMRRWREKRKCNQIELNKTLRKFRKQIASG